MAEAKGTLAKATTPTALMNKIKEMRTKWGLTGTVKTFTSNSTVITAKDFNDMVDYVTAGKTASKWTGTVQSKVSVGQLLVDKYNLLLANAESIRTYCACNCNYCSCNCDYCCNSSCNKCSSNCDNSTD